MDIDEKRLREAEIAELLLDKEIAKHQREILADGFVDLSELEEAGIKTEECMAENGIPNPAFELYPSGSSAGNKYKFTWYAEEDWTPPVERPTLSPEEYEKYFDIDDKIYRTCEKINFLAVALQWAWQERLPPDVREAVDKAFEDCVEQLGELDGSDEWLSRESDCWDEAQEVR
ncbi:hypothetical protein [Candidatus Poriferisocius sp.]|uniref:hypothetical protein n=1 Tax=Candidatus Poriferisocius sp. TaxID=3101276 RepID=UPI003B01772E